VAVEAAVKVAGEWGERELPPTFRERYSGRQSEYGLSNAEVKVRLAEAGKDAFWFLEKVDRTAPKGVRDLPEIGILRTVLRQQFPGGPGRPPAKRPTGSDIIESPHETEARYAVKRGKPWQGYKMQVTETCDEDRPNLIVDLEPTGALDNDSPELPKIQKRLGQRDAQPDEQYVDQAYMSADNLVQSAEAGINLMGVPLADTQGPKGFLQADFQIDEAGLTAICPAGQRSTVRGQRNRSKDGLPHILLRFDGRTCQQCPAFGQCTKSSQGRSLTLHPHRLALYQRRAEAGTQEFQERMHTRAGVEATISELTRGYGFRCARYRGLPKLRLQAGFTAVAVNLKRTFRWLSQQDPIAGPAQSLHVLCTTAISITFARWSDDKLRLDSTYLCC
jgi:transposase